MQSNEFALTKAIAFLFEEQLFLENEFNKENGKARSIKHYKPELATYF